MSSYSEKLRDPRWQKMRLKILQRDNFRCCECLNDKQTLHVHHLRYIKGHEPWDYEHCMLVTLCSDCHDTAHQNSMTHEWLVGEILLAGGSLSFIDHLMVGVSQAFCGSERLTRNEWSVFAASMQKQMSLTVENIISSRTKEAPDAQSNTP